jgi:hypothetical protein
MRVRGEEVFGLAMDVREIAAPTPGDENLFAGTIGMFDQRDAAATFAGFDRAHQARRSGAQN